MLNQHEKNLLLTALMFYTRLPVKRDLPYSEELLNQSRKYFTVVGLIIGLIVSLVFTVASSLFSTSIAVALSIIAGILSTGAFHEDGLADTFDALWGGWTKDDVLKIMKDSRIGTYGTVALICMLGLKATLLIELTSNGLWTWCLAVICAHSVSRMHSSRLIKSYDYVQDIDKSKIKPIAKQVLSYDAERFVYLVAIFPCVLLAFSSLSATLLALFLSYLVSSLFMTYCDKRIGGYTGDILGAIQQISELFFLLGFIVLI